MPALRRALPLLLLVAAACGGAQSSSAGRARTVVPVRLGAETEAEVEREHLARPTADPLRRVLRARLAAHFVEGAAELVAAGDYAGVLARFERVGALHRPEDYEARDLEPALVPLADFLRVKAAARGDESVALSALFVLSVIGPDPESAAREYRTVLAWGREARAANGSGFEALSELVDVWDVHARLTPAPVVLETLAKLHIERRNHLLERMRQRGDGEAFTRQEIFTAPAVLQQAPVSVAAVFLAHGDLARARTYVQGMGDTGGVERELVKQLDAAIAGDRDALLELAMLYSRLRAETTIGMCAHGARVAPKEPGFALCLARVLGEEGAPALAAAWYRDAARRAPDRREIYDEAVEAIRGFIDAAPPESVPGATRGMVRAADALVAERERRWPGTGKDASLERLLGSIGMLELNAGNLEDAAARFEASLEVRATPEAFEQLGRLSMARGDHAAAAAHYAHALESLRDEEGLAPLLTRSELHLRIGDAHRARGDAENAKKAYAAALAVLRGLEARANPFGRIEIFMRQGILEARLERAVDSEKAFRAAMEGAEALRSDVGERNGEPASAALQQTYARILSHLAAAPVPAVGLAHDIFRAAQRQMTLDPEWRVYFALWAALVAARAGATPDAEVGIVLSGHADAPGWHGALARFGLRRMDGAELLRLATNRGEQTEAHFYGVIRAIEAGNLDAAREALELTVRYRMVNFYEFMMAEELLRLPPESLRVAPAPAR